MNQLACSVVLAPGVSFLGETPESWIFCFMRYTLHSITHKHTNVHHSCHSAGPADVGTRDFSLPDNAPTELDGDYIDDLDLPEDAAIRVMPDGTNQTVTAAGQPLGDAPGFSPIGPAGTIVCLTTLLLPLSLSFYQQQRIPGCSVPYPRIRPEKR